MHNALANENNNCDCDILQIESGVPWIPGYKPHGLIGNQNFTKQNGTINGKPHYFSTQQSIISWKGQYWSYDIYDDHLKMFTAIKTYPTHVFSFEKDCTNVTWTTTWGYLSIFVKSQCLTENINHCSATKEITRNFTDGTQSKQVTLQAKNPCQFPFMYKNITYNYCIKRKKYKNDKFWCAATVDETNHLINWGYCSDLCPLEDKGYKNRFNQEDNISKSNQVAVKPSRFNFELVIGILVGILLMIACIIVGYRCTKKKKGITHKSGNHVYYRHYVSALF